MNIRKCLMLVVLGIALLTNCSEASEAEITIRLVWMAEAGVYSSTLRQVWIAERGVYTADLDLYVTEPNGEVASPLNPSTVIGGELTAGTNGLETYMLETAMHGEYTIAVRYPAYSTSSPQEASVTVLFYADMPDHAVVMNMGPETLGRTVGPTWHVGKVDFPSGTVTTEDEGGSSGCFVATAAYGSPLADEVCWLRIFRDRYLATNKAGELFLKLYYSIGPQGADFIRDKRLLKAYVRRVLKPVVFFARLAVKERG